MVFLELPCFEIPTESQEFIHVILLSQLKNIYFGFQLRFQENFRGDSRLCWLWASQWEAVILHLLNSQ